MFFFFLNGFYFGSIASIALNLIRNCASSREKTLEQWKKSWLFRVQRGLYYISSSVGIIINQCKDRFWNSQIPWNVRPGDFRGSLLEHDHFKDPSRIYFSYDLLPPFSTFDLHLGTRTLWQNRFSSIPRVFSGNKNHQQQQHHQQQQQQRHLQRPRQLWRQQRYQQRYQQLQLQRQIQLLLQEEEQHHVTYNNNRNHCPAQQPITSQVTRFSILKDLEPIIQEALPKPLNKIAFQDRWVANRGNKLLT